MVTFAAQLEEETTPEYLGALFHNAGGFNSGSAWTSKADVANENPAPLGLVECFVFFAGTPIHANENNCSVCDQPRSLCICPTKKKRLTLVQGEEEGGDTFFFDDPVLDKPDLSIHQRVNILLQRRDYQTLIQYLTHENDALDPEVLDEFLELIAEVVDELNAADPTLARDLLHQIGVHVPEQEEHYVPPAPAPAPAPSPAV